MNFSEFYKVLKHIMTKDDLGFQITEDNFNLFMVNRYLSFYHPNICKMINETSNKYDIQNNLQHYENAYEYIYNIIPKIPYKFIKYIKKPAVKNIRDNNITDEDVKNLANFYEISTREVRNMLKNI